METLLEGLDGVVPLHGLLGYLDFSTGKPDARFQKQIDAAYTYLESIGEEKPWLALHRCLLAKLEALGRAPTGPLREAQQAKAVLELAFERVLPAYRQHHIDLLGHLSEHELFQPFFLVRLIEEVIAQRSPWTEAERVISGSLGRLNDFVGHRPVPVLENGTRGEPYEHEKVRPIPLYIRDAGVAHGRYQALIERALEILRETSPTLLMDACFDLSLLDELALDPRSYDHGHPVSKRPNHVFGEWDPHHLDGQGRFRRFVLRQVTLDALLNRLESEKDIDPGELLSEASAVLAGTMLMASCVSGSGPDTHDSTVTLSTLRPRIALFRDAFYTQLLTKISGKHGARLKQESAQLRQPLGAARQHLNQYLVGRRATQVRQRQLAMLFATMGYPEESRRQAAQIATASIRLLCEMHVRFASGQRYLDDGQRSRAAELLPEIEDLLRRSIACGALIDPWNILGYQGLFPLFQSQEDSVADPRIDDLVEAVASLFHLYDRVLSEAAAAGEQDLVKRILPAFRLLATWWDKFATVAVGDVRRLHGGEAVAAAEHVAETLARWKAKGSAGADLAFWREQQGNFRTPKAFALVVDALLYKGDYRAAMALLMTWLGQAEQVPLEDGDYDFHQLALRWLLGITSSSEPIPSTEDREAHIVKFFDYLEANAEDYWHVPRLEEAPTSEALASGEEGDLYEAAWTDVTYQDSTDDDQDSSVADGTSSTGEFTLEEQAEHLQKHLRFLSTLARLWQIAARHIIEAVATGKKRAPEQVSSWLAAALVNQKDLLELLDALHASPVPKPSGSFDSVVEFDHRRVLKDNLTYSALSTCLDTILAAATLQGASGVEPSVESVDSFLAPEWGPLAGQLERALLCGDAAEARDVLPAFLRLFRKEPLLFSALSDGGHPRQILRVRLVQNVLRSLAASLPRLGLLRETYHLLRIARTMELAHPPAGRGVTQFNELFQAAFQAVIQAIVAGAETWGPPYFWPSSEPRGVGAAVEKPLADLLERVASPFLKLWVEQANTMQISCLEGIRSEDDWEKLRSFVRRYGGTLFHPKFLALANLRGVLQSGVGAYLDYLADNADPLHPVRLLDEIDQQIPREQAIAMLQFVIQALVENYVEYKDYNNSAAQSDYGENLHILLDFLRLKSKYDRHAWQLRPLVWVHESLVRARRYGTAVLWREAFIHYIHESAAKITEDLQRLEQTHGVRLASVSELIQEKFVRALDLDSLCSWIEPVMEDVGEEDRYSIESFQEELRSFEAAPSGAGLEVPHWLRLLEAEIHKVQLAQTSIGVLANQIAPMPMRALAFADLERQLLDWNTPLAGAE